MKGCNKAHERGELVREQKIIKTAKEMEKADKGTIKKLKKKKRSKK